MEVKKAKGGIYSLAFFVMLILLNTYCCSAALLFKSNTTVLCNGLLDECLIEDDLDLDLEFLMNPYIGRLLADTKGGIYDSLKASSPACNDGCGRPKCDAKNVFACR